MKLDTLYKLSSKQAHQQWDIGTEDAVIITRWGQIGGAIQETRDEVSEGKNIGRSNATTPQQQAEMEALSRWEKKLKRGYVMNLDDAISGKVDDIIEGGVFPMLAEKFDEFGHLLQYPCLGQPKFDGHRCEAAINDGVCVLWSRSRKRIISLPHINKAIESLGLPDMILDGELYNHDYKENFEDLTSFIKDSKVKPGSEVVQFHVYDIVNDRPQSERTEMLRQLLTTGSKPKHHSIVCVDTVEVKSKEHLMEVLDLFLEQGYEGAMARSMNGKYTINKRSRDLLKVKVFTDAEFKITGVLEGRGKLKGHAVFVCETAEGTSFKAKMKGKTSELKQYFDDPSLAIGRLITVRYQGITKKNRVPRFPVAVRFYEAL